MVPMCWGGGAAGYGTHVLGWYPCVGVEELAMVPTCTCWGRGAGYGTHNYVGVEKLAMVPMCWDGTHVLGWRS